MNYSAYYPILLKDAQKLPLYLAVVGIVNKENGIFRKNGIEHYQILMTKSGSGYVNINTKSKIAQKGSLFILPPNVCHDYYGKLNPWTTYCLTFGGLFADNILNRMCGIYTPKDFDKYTNLFFEILKEEKNGDWIYNTSAKLYKLILELKKDFIDKASKDAVIEYIKENYNKTLELSELSAILGIAPQSLCRAFKNKYGTTVFNYISLIRIQKAKELLVSNRELSIDQIASMTGFTNASYFCKIFKKYENISPTKFRKNE